MEAESKQPERLVTAEEVAAHLGYEKGTIYSKVSRGEIPFVKLGHSVRFRLSEIDAWVRAQNEARNGAAEQGGHATPVTSNEVGL